MSKKHNLGDKSKTIKALAIALHADLLYREKSTSRSLDELNKSWRRAYPEVRLMFLKRARSMYENTVELLNNE